MSVAELLGQLSDRGIRLWTEGGSLRYRAPGKALTQDLRSALVEHKAEILEVLLRRPAPGAVVASSKLVPAPREAHVPFPLTEIQQAYWIGRSEMFELGNISAHIYQEIGVPDLDLERFEQAWNRLIKRHGMLRSVVLRNGEQQVSEQVPHYQIRSIDLTDRDPQAAEDELETVRQHMSHAGPSVETWPLFEMVAYRVDKRQTRLCVSVSLLICDALSFRILMHELDQLYGDLDAPLRPLRISYRDYVLALTDFVSTTAYERSLTFWREQLDALPPAPDLPCRRRPGKIDKPKFQRRRAQLEPAGWERLKARAQRAGVTPTVALATAYATVLVTWSKSRHFLLNLLFFNRLPLHPEVGRVVGNFSSTLLLEVDLRQPASFEDSARQLQERMWASLEHSRVTGIRVLREWNKALAGSSRVTLPVVLASTLNLTTEREAESASSNLGGDILGGSLQTPQVWLDHQVSERPDGSLAFNWDAVEALFPEGMVQAMFDAYRGLLRCLADAEDVWAQPIPNLTPPAHLSLRSAINATEAPVSPHLLHSLFAEQCRQRPREIAVVSERSLTYEELSQHSACLERQLRRRGVAPDTLVAVVMEKGWQQAVAVLAVVRSGAAYLPIDPALPRARQWYLLEHAQARIALTQPWLVESLDWPPDVECLRVGEEDSSDTVEGDGPSPQSTDLAYVIYTSGSTGQPKGVMIDHRGAVNTLVDLVQRFHLGPQDRLIALSSLSFDLSVFDVFGTLAAGAAMVFPDAARAREPAHWTDLAVRHRITVWNSVPALMEMWVDYLETRPGAAPDSLRLVMLSGDWIPVTLPGRIRRLFADVQVISLGGATEASIWSILYPIAQVDPDWPSIPYGRPMVNQTFLVLDEAFAPCPTWVPGQLYIGGLGLARGYWLDEEKTRRSFISHPGTGERLYRTGDLGRYLPGGDIEFLGREDFQVKVGGYRIELGEVEAHLTHHPGVASAVASVYEERGVKRLVAYVTALPEHSVNGDELRDFLRLRLPDYMMPASIVQLESLPLTANGKVDRQALPDPGDATAAARGARRVNPRDQIELRLTQIWQNVLDVESVGVDDNFFELGGHSLMAVRMMAQVEQQLGRDLPLATLLEGGTVAHLASILRQQVVNAGRSPLVGLRTGGGKRPFFCVHPVGGNVMCYLDLAARLDVERPIFGLQAIRPQTEDSSDSVEAMARRYLEAISTVEPTGPYLLGGWSMGGVVAFEMARQLHAQGREVALLVMFDAAVPGQGLAAKLDDAELVARFASDMAGLTGKDLALDLEELRSLSETEQLDRVLTVARRAELLTTEVETAQIQRHLDLFKSNFRALVEYRPGFYSGRVHLVRAAAEGEAQESEPTWGWAKLADGGVDLHRIPGSHYSLVREPTVAALAELLEIWFDPGE